MMYNYHIISTIFKLIGCFSVSFYVFINDLLKTKRNMKYSQIIVQAVKLIK